MVEITAKVVLTDIEGTTTSISFVKDVLFPYAKLHTSEFLQANWQLDATKKIVKDLTDLPEYKTYLKENALEADYTVEGISKLVNYFIDKDLKLGPLKTLQGLVWAQGYEKGELKGHVYEDVEDALKRWQAAGLTIAIYSSGSVKAQKLLFGRTVKGDLLPYINAHFDTQVGHKQEKQSYINIAKELNVTPADILFLTDVVGEAEAARAAGMKAVLLNRPGNAPLTDDEKSAFSLVNDFESLKVTLKRTE